MYKVCKGSIKPRSKYKRTNDRRMFKIINYYVQVAMTRNQILTIRSQHGFQKGGIVGTKESGNEMILNNRPI